MEQSDDNQLVNCGHLRFAQDGVLVVVVMFGEVEVLVLAGGILQEGRTGAEVLLRAQRIRTLATSL